MKKLTLTIIYILFLQLFVLAQENPFRIGVKFGIPNLAGLSLEYATPILDNKIAASLDYSSISIKADGNEISFYYLEAGGNYYFIKKGKGLYSNLSFGRIGFKGNYKDPLLGSGEGNANINLINLKLGAKLGNIFYLRPEIGFGIITGNSQIEVEYIDPSSDTSIKQKEEIPGFLSGGGLFNVGFGISF